MLVRIYTLMLINQHCVYDIVKWELIVTLNSIIWYFE